jgi:hypothetical protein
MEDTESWPSPGLSQGERDVAKSLIRWRILKVPPLSLWERLGEGCREFGLMEDTESALTSPLPEGEGCCSGWGTDRGLQRVGFTE